MRISGFDKHISVNLRLHRLVGSNGDISIFISWLLNKYTDKDSEFFNKEGDTWIRLQTGEVDSLFFSSRKQRYRIFKELSDKGILKYEYSDKNIFCHIEESFLQALGKEEDTSFENNELEDISVKGDLYFIPSEHGWGGDVEKLQSFMMSIVRDRPDLDWVEDEDLDEIFELILWEKGKCILAGEIDASKPRRLFSYIARYFLKSYQDKEGLFDAFKFDYIWTKIHKYSHFPSCFRSEFRYCGHSRFNLYCKCNILYAKMPSGFERNLEAYVGWRKEKGKRHNLNFFFTDVDEFISSHS